VSDYVEVSPSSPRLLFRNARGGAAITVRVTPRAGRTAIAGTRDHVLLVKLAAAPVDGAANDTLIQLLSDSFSVPKRDIRIAAGERGRTKHVLVSGRSASALNAMLAPLLGEG
jgi:uncharacterized protein